MTSAFIAVSRNGESNPSTNKIMDQLPSGQKNMTFTSGTTMNLTSGTTVTFTSGNVIRFTTGVKINFTWLNASLYFEPCWVGKLNVLPLPIQLVPCSWWELIDPNTGHATGIEFHVDKVGTNWFHVDVIIPGPIQLPPLPYWYAELKIDSIAPCDEFVIYDPPEWGPPVCSWWEVLSPPQWVGMEFHVDWSNASCEFHIDEVLGIQMPIIPWPYEVIAEQKITEITPCVNLYVADPAQVPEPCTWWEIVFPQAYYGYEFHVDQNLQNGSCHIDQVTPGPIVFPLPPPYQLIAEKKITQINPCTTLKISANPSGILPLQCEWYEITYPTILKGYEFHIDWSDGTYLHIDEIIPQPTPSFTTYEIVVERKIPTIIPCDNFKIVSPTGWHPDICSWWNIVDPPQWRGVKFHIDTWNGVNNIFWFHIDSIDPLPPGPAIPPYNVTAEPYVPPLYWKPSFPDYAPSGMPDFDERQGQTYLWQDLFGSWSHCAPTAVANSLWWLDSKFETNTIPPPVVIDNFPLVSTYATMPPIWDDHDPQNAPYLIEHLAYLMDTNGIRTGIIHSGTTVTDIQTGIAQYLSWTGVNPKGDVNGDGIVNQTDLNIVNAALGSVPGSPTWNMTADIAPVTTGWPNRNNASNSVNAADVALVTANMNKTGMFYERTTVAPTFAYIEAEVEKCEDVELTLGFWHYEPSTQQWYREGDPIGHVVTAAGVNSTTLKLAISDPIYDAYETGLISQGYVPVPHVHMAPEPPYITHNDAKYVSQDIYDVTWISPPMPPCPGGNWTLIGYPGAPQGFMTVIENAVVTSPQGVHDVAVTNVTTSKDGCRPMPTVSGDSFAKVNVTVLNKGNFTETDINVTVYANTTSFASQNVTLSSGNSMTITFTWNTTGFAYGNYTISAYAWPVPGETNTANNNLTGATVQVTIPGDVNGDGTVNILDAIQVSNSFLATPSSSNWNPNADINSDNVVNILDAIILANHFLQHYP
jgi:hypothetical protein